MTRNPVETAVVRCSRGRARPAPTLPPGAILDRDSILAEVGSQRERRRTPSTARSLADLRGAHRLTEFRAPSPGDGDHLRARAGAGGAPGRGSKSRSTCFAPRPAARTLFSGRLKFLRLLHTVARTENGHRSSSTVPSAVRIGNQVGLPAGARAARPRALRCLEPRRPDVRLGHRTDSENLNGFWLM